MLMTGQDQEQVIINELFKSHSRQRSALIPILQALQVGHGYISEFAMQYIADCLNIHAAEVYGLATFYHFVNTRPKGKFIIRLSRDMSSMMKGAKVVARQLENDLAIRFGETTPDGMFTLEWTSCIGMNYQAPAMMVNNEVFSNLTAPRVHRIIEDCRQEFSSHRPTVGNVSETYSNTTTYSSYKVNAALTKTVTMTPAAVIAELTASGLRGRGGAGFPTGMKWGLAAAAKGDRKYIVCNADEGEPGTFKDRIILGKHADMVFEAMTVAAYVVGSREGIVYLRYEYSHLRPHLNSVLTARRQANLLGDGILGRPGFDFDIRIHMGAGAYVCGEETALIEIAGRAPRRAAQSAAVSGRTRLQQLPDRGEQRRDAGVGLLHPRSRRQVVRQHGHRPLQGVQAVQCLRRLLAPRGLRAALGYHRQPVAGYGRWQGSQGGAGGRLHRAARAGPPVRPKDRL